ncbi:hypothetical protein AS034_11220 [[Bacillus] enclensis]|uniref:NIPSNAP protein n=1 Tax=[Bacillus] enclensis TaxID=1402860 RepID=A0A0V8HKI6_9BACI|nr:NIPSNAP family protein [[Bacillus] enclensis]KSU62673.1 hypothetical protein AS034_11220 [[Bacillus] enclensis]SCC07866.1 NIPSNAP protein [[Bacillus] enclensis]
MVYRVRTYCIKPDVLETFNSFFHEFLLPNQLRFGAKLIGRWINEDKTQITAIWEYKDKLQYINIEKKIKKTKLHKQAQNRKSELGSLYLSTSQEFWYMTGNYHFLGGRQ